MEKLISSRSNIESVPGSYVLPLETRPGKLVVPLCKTIPVIELENLGVNREELIKQIVEASREYGFFQLTKHGVPMELMSEVLLLAKEFFELPSEQIARFYSEDPKQSCRLYTSINYDKEKVHFWRDNLRHPCHPLEDFVQQWPEYPSRYREIVGRYAVEVRKLSLLLIDLIYEGLGLEPGCLNEGLTQVQLMNLNHYPPCPDPSVTLGLPKHSDVNLITLLNQSQVPGLQVLKDDQWLSVEPLPNAFVVNIGYMLQILSNGKVKSADHRVVTNTSKVRTTVGSFIHPHMDCFIEPEKSLIDLKSSPSLFIPFTYKDFVSSYIADTSEGLFPLARYTIQS